MKKLELWACLGHSDRNEGRGPMRVVCYAESQETAVEIVTSREYGNEHGVFGSRCSAMDVRKETVMIYSSAQEYLDPIRIRREALAKLTAEERKVLGL